MERLRKLRNLKGWNQEHVANLIGVKSITISRYEKGERQPDNRVLVRLAEIFEVSTDYLLGKTDTKKAPNAESTGDEIKDKMNKIYDRLPPEGKAKAVQILNTIFPEHAEPEEPEEV